MSFTAEVKNELSRVGILTDSQQYTAVAPVELSALLHVCGSLSFQGSGSYALRITTETGLVARIIIQMTNELFNLDTQLTVRRSTLHKTRNYLVEIANQPHLEATLNRLGILMPGRGLVAGIAPELVTQDEQAIAYIRGAFIGGGFIADPRHDFHLEIAVSGEAFAHDLQMLLCRFGIDARLNRRRGSHVLYLKNFDAIEKTLQLLGATRSALALAKVRHIRSAKNDVNRHINAELANQARSVNAALNQIKLIDAVDEKVGIENISPALREFCELRRKYPEESLCDLGKKAHPQISKSALYHRVLRLEKLLEEK